MPTGYTAKLMEKGQTFPEFAMTCARAFGHLISMRDEPLDAPIPEKIGGGSYYERAYNKALATKAELDAMDDTARLKKGRQLKKYHVNYTRRYAARKELEDTRLREMVDMVKAWKPPTKDHVNLKQFMSEQLSMSYNDSAAYYKRELERLEAKTPMEFFTEHLDAALRDVTSYAEHALETSANNVKANEWLQALRDSLRTPGTKGARK